MVVSHGHPDLGPGGAEHAAYALFRGLQEEGIEALFVARRPPSTGESSRLSQHAGRGDEILLSAEAEHFRFSQRVPEVILEDFPSLLEWFRPTVVHFHHYSSLGLELFSAVRRYSESTRIVLTFHEYLAICNNDGQLTTRPDRSLCAAPTPAACARCFPEYSEADFLLRELYVKRHLRMVDAFVSPSDFLIGRYVDWGLPRSRFHLIENPLPDVRPARSRSDRSDFPGRFGFFGQMHPNKGLHVALQAMAILPEEYRAGPTRITLDVWGARLGEQSNEYQTEVASMLAGLGDRVAVHGRYRQGDVGTLMQAVDWVTIPSTWYENSPIVIQEAFASRTPVICSGIGGMAEKVEDGVTGLHVRHGDARDLADTMVKAATTVGLRERLSEAIPAMPDMSRSVGSHLELYGSPAE